MSTPLGVPVVPARPGNTATPAPATGPLIDTYGRVATDLRVSLSAIGR
jgi:cyclic pyranopterin phosphate synthase